MQEMWVDPWVGKIPWRRKPQPTPGFLPAESHGRRSLEGYSPRGHKAPDTTQRLNNNKGQWGCQFCVGIRDLCVCVFSRCCAVEEAGIELAANPEPLFQKSRANEQQKQLWEVLEALDHRSLGLVFLILRNMYNSNFYYKYQEQISSKGKICPWNRFGFEILSLALEKSRVLSW